MDQAHDGRGDQAAFGSERGESPSPRESAFGALREIMRRVESAAPDDPALAEACAVLGRWLLDIGSRRAPTVDDDASAPAPTDSRSRVERLLRIGDGATTVSVPQEVGLGSAERDALPAQTPGDAPPRPATTPLSTIVARSLLKAECCRWAMDRRRRMEEDADFDQSIKPRDVELRDRLRTLPDCYAWSLDPYASLPDDRRLDDAAGCYEALADAVELAALVESADRAAEGRAEQIYRLVAECCSALRRSLLDAGVEKDADQQAAFDWLRARVFEDQIYIDRHMRLDDPADPSAWPDRRDAAARVRAEIGSARAAEKEERNLIGRLGYIAKRWGDYDGAEVAVQAQKFADAVDQLVAIGLRPSDPRIREPLLTLIDNLPDGLDVSGPFSEALRFADEHIARREAEGQAPPTEEGEPIAEVRDARELLRGKVAVLVGGTCRPRSRDALRDGLELSELRWIATREHESVSNFEAQVRKRDVDLVILAIRWSSHSFEAVKSVCERDGIPFVRLPRGYGVNQIAREVMQQASNRLRQG